MSRTNIELDDQAVHAVMERYDFATMREAVNYALRRLADEPLTRDEALAMEGRGWDGNLEEMRQGRSS